MNAPSVIRKALGVRLRGKPRSEDKGIQKPLPRVAEDPWWPIAAILRKAVAAGRDVLAFVGPKDAIREALRRDGVDRDYTQSTAAWADVHEYADDSVIVGMVSLDGPALRPIGRRYIQVDPNEKAFRVPIAWGDMAGYPIREDEDEP